jgi:hypothetical protein
VQQLCTRDIVRGRTFERLTRGRECKTHCPAEGEMEGHWHCRVFKGLAAGNFPLVPVLSAYGRTCRAVVGRLVLEAVVGGGTGLQARGWCEV